MSIRTTISGDFVAIDLRKIADDMLGDVVANHAAERFAAGNAANAALAGEFVPYSVSVNGRNVARGRGAVMPKAAVAAVIGKSARRTPHIVSIAWNWTLQPGALKRALDAYFRLDAALARVNDAASFVRLVMNAREESLALFHFLLERYVAFRFPTAFRRAEQGFALYRVYRALRLGARLIGGDRQEAADVEVLAWIAKELLDRSPVVSGAYRDAHTLYADQSVVMAASEVSDDADVPDAEEYSFTNTTPYARKIEIGKTKAGRDFVIQVPNRIYERVAQDAQARFRGAAEISFEMRAVLGGDQINQARAARLRRPSRAASGVTESRAGRRYGATAHNSPDVRYPTIIVRF